MNDVDGNYVNAYDLGGFHARVDCSGMVMRGTKNPVQTDTLKALRDEFAGLAMQGDLIGGVHHDNFDITAKRAYMMADAMLAAREAK